MAQGNYGTSNNPLEEIHGEQVVYEPLTSDPSDREEGSRWFRSDLDSGDKIGTLRLQNDDAGTNIDDIPVFAESETTDGVVKARPIRTTNGEGFIPYVQEGGTFHQLRFQHNGTWYGAHNSLTALPDAGNLQVRYDATLLGLSDQDSVSSWSDEVGSNNLTASGDPLYETNEINGHPTVFTDGDDDVLTGNAFGSGDYTVAFVARHNSPLADEFNRVIANGDDDSTGWTHAINNDTNNNEYGWSHTAVGANDSGLTADGNPIIIVARYDASTDSLQVNYNGTEQINASTGYNDPTGTFYVGAGALGDGTVVDYTDANFGEILAWSVREDDSTVSDIESYLNGKWGPIL